MAYAVVLTIELAVLLTLFMTCGRQAPLVVPLGYAAAASFVAMQVYSVRRRARVLRSAGPLERWLDAHVFLGLQGVLFAVYHGASLRPALDLGTAIAAIVGVLALSGIVGRYVPALRRHLIWSLIHRPLAFALFSLIALHVVAHVAYAR